MVVNHNLSFLNTWFLILRSTYFELINFASVDVYLQ
jgi:hypothetical protein